MKQFIVNAFIFSLFMLFATHLAFALKIYEKIVPGSDVYTAIKRSVGPKKEASILFLGDSVGKQLFDSLNGKSEMVSLACNQAIDMIGHFLLLDNYTSKPNSIKYVYMLLNPFSLKNDLDHKYTYNYFLKPFYRTEYIDRFTEHTFDQISNIPFSAFSIQPLVKITPFTPNYSPKRINGVLSITSIEYMGMIIRLSKKNEINFTILSPPIKESRRNEVHDVIEKYKLSLSRSKVMDEYFDHIKYLPDSLYSDHIHFKKEFISEARKKVMLDFTKYSHNTYEPSVCQ
jgi:hypothetical protein